MLKKTEDWEDVYILLYKLQKWSESNVLLSNFDIHFVSPVINTNNPSSYIDIKGKKILSRITCWEIGDCDIELFILNKNESYMFSNYFFHNYKDLLLYLNKFVEILLFLEIGENILYV